jgi:hypothetical protein
VGVAGVILCIHKAKRGKRHKLFFFKTLDLFEGGVF